MLGAGASRLTAGADVLLFEAPAVDFRLSVLGMVNCDLEEVDFLLEEGVVAADVDAVEVPAADGEEVEEVISGFFSSLGCLMAMISGRGRHAGLLRPYSLA